MIRFALTLAASLTFAAGALAQTASAPARPVLKAEATVTGLSFAASVACVSLKYGSPNAMSLPRVAGPGGSARKVRSAAAEGTIVTACVRASHGTLA